MPLVEGTRQLLENQKKTKSRKYAYELLTLGNSMRNVVP